MKKNHENTNYKELCEHYQLEAEAYHLFYSNMRKYDDAVMTANAIAVGMMSEVIQAKIKNPRNEKLKPTEKRVMDLMACLETISGFFSKYHDLSITLRKSAEKRIKAENEAMELKKELEAIKTAWSTQE